jgi:hypothetical protein
MKAIKITISLILFTLIMSITLPIFAQIQTPEEYAAMKKLLETGQYVFHAQVVTPLSGDEKLITEDYFLAVTKDSVMADLPYLGQVYAVPMNTNDIGIKFTSHKYDYMLRERKKGGFDISVVPQNVRDHNVLKISIYKDGATYLYVTNNSRQSISFRGYISASR